MDPNKSIVILTSFFDANYLISNGYMLYKSSVEELVYKLNFLQDESKNPLNYTVNSIALASPPLASLTNIRSMDRIDCLCPTYTMLNDYKKDNNWERYTERYLKLLKDRKSRMKDWISSLKPNHVYFLCCWENTSRGSNCHRKLYYDLLKKSKKANETVFPIYRSGSCSIKPDEVVIDINENYFTSTPQRLPMPRNPFQDSMTLVPIAQGLNPDIYYDTILIENINSVLDDVNVLNDTLNLGTDGVRANEEDFPF